MDGLLLWCVLLCPHSAVTGDPRHCQWVHLVHKLSVRVKQAPATLLVRSQWAYSFACVVDLSSTRPCTFFTRPERWSNRKRRSTTCLIPCWPTQPSSAAAALPEAGQPLPSLSPQTALDKPRGLFSCTCSPWGAVKTSEILGRLLEICLQQLACLKALHGRGAWGCSQLWAGSAGMFSCLKHGSRPGACQGSAFYASGNQFSTRTSK